MFLSLKRHVDGPAAELPGALIQLSQRLLRSMRLHVIRSDEGEVRRYQSAVLSLERRLESAPAANEVMAMAGEAATAFEDHCHYTNRFLEVQATELAGMMGMLTATVSSISTASQAAVEELSKVEKRMENLSFDSDLPKLKLELAECLAMVREESFRQREQSANTIHTLQRGVRDTRRRMAAVLPEAAGDAPEPLMRDPVTALAGRADAEDALAQARMKKNVFAAVLPVDRLALVNTRFGTQATDVVVRYFVAYLQRHLQGKDLLFRWSENAFLALVEREQTQDSVRADLSRFASAKVELALEHHGREILLPVSSTWALFAAVEGRTHEALVGKIEGFLKNEMHLKDSF